MWNYSEMNVFLMKELIELSIDWQLKSLVIGVTFRSGYAIYKIGNQQGPIV